MRCGHTLVTFTPLAGLGLCRTGRCGWVKATLNALYEHGIDRVKVEVLAGRQGVTKGSFYWHFKDRADLLKAVIAYWKARQVELVRGIADDPAPEPESRLVALMAFIQSKDSRHDIGVRAWALVDLAAAAAVRAVDKQRIAFVESVFARLGFDPFESKLRARTLYFYQVGEHTSSIRDGGKLRAKLARARFDWLVTGSSPARE